MDLITKFIEKSINLFSWLRIAISPTIIGFVIGFIIYINKTDIIGLSIGIILTIVGLITGIWLAQRAKKSVGTTEFISRVNASPDFDEISKKHTSKK